MEIQPLGYCFDGLALRLRLLVASVPGSPAGSRDGACLVLDQVVSGSSASGAEFEFWRPGALCWFPARSTLWQLKTSRSSSDLSRLLMGFLPPTAGRSFIGGTSAWSGPLWQVIAISLAFGLVDSRAGMVSCLSSPPLGVVDGDVSVPLSCASTGILSGQSWPLLDFPLCRISEGLCRSSLASPSRCLSEYAPFFHRLVSPRCGCV